MSENKFSIRFAKLKEESGKTLKELSSKDELGVSVSNLSYYMNGREPNYDTLCKIADYFGVTTDYLVGRSDIRTLEDELASRVISGNSRSKFRNVRRAEQVEYFGTKLYNELFIAADEELDADKDYNIWEIVGEFLSAISNYREFLRDYKPQNYPLTPAMEAMHGFHVAERTAFIPVRDMLETLIKDPDADEQLKKRVAVKMAFSIKPESLDE